MNSPGWITNANSIKKKHLSLHIIRYLILKEHIPVCIDSSIKNFICNILHELNILSIFFPRKQSVCKICLSYLFGYKMGFFPFLEWLQRTKSVPWNFARIQVLPFLNNPKDLDQSYKTDSFGRKKTPSYNRRNMVHRHKIILKLTSCMKHHSTNCPQTTLFFTPVLDVC